MPLTKLTAKDEVLLDACVEGALRDGLARSGRAVLLVPSFDQALVVQRELAARPGLSLGVTVSTPPAWAGERWEVWGDGRRVVDATSRDVLAQRVLERAAARPGARVALTRGGAALLSDLAREGLFWLVRAQEPPAGVTSAEHELVACLSAYASELSVRGLVEECEVMARVPGVLEEAGAEVPAVVVAGFAAGEMRRAARELVEGLAKTCEVTVVEAGVAGASASGRAPELAGLLGALFSAGEEPLVPTGAVRLLLPAGPSAEAELVARELGRLAEEGARDVVVVAADAGRAWRELSARLVARGIGVRASLSCPVTALEAGRAYLELVRTVARLAELDATWPAPVEVEGGIRVGLGDMSSWWPPRQLSDFMLSDISHVEAARARALDASWRANRLLTPAVVLAQLTSEKDTSPEVASAVREVLRGRLGSAASKLLAPYVRGDRQGAPAAEDAVAALTSVLAVAKSLKELGISADPDAPGACTLSELVDLAEEVLERTKVRQRPERVVEGAAARVRILSAAEASRLAPASVDALVLMGQTSTEAAIPAPDDVRAALLDRYGVEPLPDAMARARRDFSRLVAVPRRELVLERLLFGADGKPCYPSVMLTELCSCYGVEADARPEELAAALGAPNVVSRGELSVRENASCAGVAPQVEARELSAPAGKIPASARELVSPPPEGVSVEDNRPLLSASQIETYLECPYKWFSLRRLRLKDADAGFTGAEMGTFAHRVLEVTHAELLARAVERAAGTHVLADLRAAGPDATQTEPYRQAVADLVARAQEDPTLRVEGSSTQTPEARAEAEKILSEEFDAHLSHQYQLMGKGRRPLPQALVAHSAQEEGQLRGLRRDLTTLLGFEGELLSGFEPRYFEWGFGRAGDEVEYAGVRLTGTVDRVDVDAHGNAVVIDYKHKSDAGFAGEYDVFPKEGAEAVEGGIYLPRRVQSLIYGQVMRRRLPGVTVVGAVYLCTKGGHALAGAVDENLVDNVFGELAPSSRRLPRLAVPRLERFGRPDSSGMEALLDASEEAIAAKVARLLAGDIEANPTDAEACRFCPVLNCERRLKK